MSNFVEQHYVNQFSSNVMHLSQQKGSRLAGAVRNESQRGEKAFYDRIHSVAATKKLGRHSPTPLIETEHSRRMVSLEDYEWADLIDAQDLIRMLTDPKSQYSQAAMWAFGRIKDDTILASGLGTAYSGKEGETPVVLPNTRKIHAVKSSALSNLNVDTLRMAKHYFDKEEVEGERYAAVTSSQLMSLLGENEVTSADYNTIRALVNGEVNSFMGFKFIQLERVVKQPASGAPAFSLATGEYNVAGTAANNSRKCMFWAKDGVILSTGENITSKADERNDLSYAMQVYMRMSIGGVRMEEVKVLEVNCKEA
jgi:hypothetical protein